MSIPIFDNYAIIYNTKQNIRFFNWRYHSPITANLDAQKGLTLYRDWKIGIAVPAYNEEELIEVTLTGMPSYVDRIYVCNDASTDCTLERVQAVANNDSRIVLISHEKNTGVGGAIIDCHLRGMADGMDIMAVMAGDNQMDPLELHKLLDPIIDGKTDFAKGNRLYWREALTGMSRWRLFGNSILTLMNKGLVAKLQ